MKMILDYDKYPEPEDSSPLQWFDFTVPFSSQDRELGCTLPNICEQNLDRLVDLRPYMIEDPETCNKHDFLPKIVARFRHLHLRHLVVTNPFNGKIEGMITRGDIFRYMPL